MIHIGKSYIIRQDGISRLCADITVCRGQDGVAAPKDSRTLWFAIDGRQEEYLSLGWADAFVMLMLRSAMLYGHDIVCEDPMSERLHYQLCSSLIPTLASAGTILKEIAIHAPLTASPYPNLNAVGTGFSGGADCLYTIMTHGKTCEYPLTHITVFNAVVFQKYGTGYREIFRDTCRAAEKFAREQGLETVFLDTNFNEVIEERNTNSICPRNHLACALALQGLFSCYYVSAFVSADEFHFDLSSDATYDLLNIACLSTETLRFYSAGAECKRYEKFIRLSDWEPSCRWLHACYSKKIAGTRNCGLCKKCKEAQTILYALDKLDRYAAVFDVEEFKRNFPRYLAYIMANQEDARAREVMKVVRERNIPIPPKSYVLERQMRHAVQAAQRKHATQTSQQKRQEGNLQ